MNSRLLVEVAVRNAIDDGLRLFVMLEGIGSKAGEWGSPPQETHRPLALRLTDTPIFFKASVIFSSNWTCLSGTQGE
jgi:hypothetical protein